MTECGFTHDHYIDTLVRYRDAGYEVMRFVDYARMGVPPEKALILRHDVVFSPVAAADMASLEEINGFLSSYYYRVHSRIYNLFGTCNMYPMWGMESAGHEIGLRIGVGESRILHEFLSASIFRQLHALRLVANKSIWSVSMHHPASPAASECVADWCRETALFFTCDDQYIKDIKYISDSSAGWSEGCFCNWINKAPRLQVLIHPVWWHGNVPEEYY